MSEKANYFKIGLFFISGTILAVIAVIILGAGTFFQKKIFLETYFEESVQGLDTGSPVKFRGVLIGNVEKITFADKEYNTEHRYVLILVSLFPDVTPMEPGEVLFPGLEKEIGKGLRVRLSFLGVTGTAYLEVDYLDPERNPSLPIDWYPKHPYVPSAPGTITRLSESLDRIMKNLEQINIQEIAQDLKKSLHSISKAADEGKIAETLAHLRRSAYQIDSLVSNRRQDLEEIIENIERISKNLRELTENSKKYPSLLLFGEQPTKFKSGRSK